MAKYSDGGRFPPKPSPHKRAWLFLHLSHPMRDLSAGYAALRDALRHASQRGGMSSLGVLHPSAKLSSSRQCCA